MSTTQIVLRAAGAVAGITGIGVAAVRVAVDVAGMRTRGSRHIV